MRHPACAAFFAIVTGASARLSVTRVVRRRIKDTPPRGFEGWFCGLVGRDENSDDTGQALFKKTVA